MSFHFKLAVREDDRLSLDTVLKLAEPTPGAPSERRAFRVALKGLVEALREAIKAKRNAFLREYGLKLESRPPMIMDGELYTGQWAGMAEYVRRVEGLRVALTLMVEPKYPLFHEVYREVARFVGEALKPLAEAVMDMALASPGGLGNVSLAAWLLERYVDVEPPHVYRLELGCRGGTLIKAAPRPMLARVVVEPNWRLYSTLRIGLSLLSRVIRRQLLAVPDALKRLLEEYRREQAAILSVLLARPQVRDALAAPVIDEVDPDVLLAVRAATRAMLVPGRRGATRLLMIPTTKMYELYVLAKVVKVLGGVFRAEKPSIIHCGEATIYYNKPPKKLSRVAAKLSHRVPRPDLTVVKDRTVVVVDAKYREDVERLELKETLRLLGYVADLARDAELKAIVVCLSKRTAGLKAKLNDMGVNIRVVEVNAERSELEVLKKLIDYH